MVPWCNVSTLDADKRVDFSEDIDYDIFNREAVVCYQCVTYVSYAVTLSLSALCLSRQACNEFLMNPLISCHISSYCNRHPGEVSGPNS